MTDINVTYSGGSFTLHKPYWGNISGNLSFTNTNMSFRYGHYASYIDEISDETICLTGFESVTPMAKFISMCLRADNGEPITLSNINSAWSGVYIIQSFSFKPIGIDVFEYRLNLRLVS